MALHLNTRLQLLDCRPSLFTTGRLTPEEFQGNSRLPPAHSTPREGTLQLWANTPTGTSPSLSSDIGAYRRPYPDSRYTINSTYDRPGPRHIKPQAENSSSPRSLTHSNTQDGQKDRRWLCPTLIDLFLSYATTAQFRRVTTCMTSQFKK